MRRPPSDDFVPDFVKVRKERVGGLVPGGLRAVAQKPTRPVRQAPAAETKSVRQSTPASSRGDRAGVETALPERARLTMPRMDKPIANRPVSNRPAAKKSKPIPPVPSPVAPDVHPESVAQLRETTAASVPADSADRRSRKSDSPAGPLRVTIEKLVQGGYGLAREGGQALFVRGAIPGETVEVSVAQTHKQYREASVVRIVEASPDRVTPPCPVYGACGGCHLQHLRYDAQVALKREMFLETLARVGKIDMPEVAQVPPVVSASQDYGTRAVVRFAVLRQDSGLSLGFHREGSAKVIPVTDCVVLPEALRAVVAALSSRLAALSRPPCRIESIELRTSTSSGDVLMIVQTDARAKRQAETVLALMRGLPGLVGCIVQGAAAARSPRWTEGQDWLAERLDDMLIRISDRSFLQSNWAINKALSETVVAWAAPTPGLRVLELYAGIGTLGLPLAKRGALVTLVEGNPTALADARRAAEGNHIGRCRFRPVAAEAFLPTAAPGEYDLVLIDPPRTGLTAEALDGVAALKAPRLLYVSCDPATLARDLSRLGAGVRTPDRVYTIARMQAFDMFPQTAHLEALVELHRVPESAR